jgi:hypothetical protein
MPDRLSQDLVDGALALADAARQANVRYALIGGLATGYRTRARFTRDMDFLLHVPQLALPAFLDELAPRIQVRHIDRYPRMDSAAHDGTDFSRRPRRLA